MKHQTNFGTLFFAAALFSACFDNSSSADSANKFDAAVVCPVEGTNVYGDPNRGTFTDARDGQVYKYTTIGKQVWMAENLKFDAPYSLCYGKIEGFCDTFGRFYSLHVNGELYDLFDQELLDTICPAGWHIPSVEEWNKLADSMGGVDNAGHRLMSSLDFGERYEPGSDDCQFNSLPAGYWLKDGNLYFEYTGSTYWSSTAKDLGSSYSCGLTNKEFGCSLNHPKMSIRCLND